jgi:hypothetical protein
MSDNTLHLCTNCLTGGARGVPVGQEKGSQMDPYRETIPLCPDCATALVGGDLGTFARRYRSSRKISRDGGDDLRSRLISALEERDFVVNSKRAVRDQGPLTATEAADVVMEVIGA